MYTCYMNKFVIAGVCLLAVGGAGFVLFRAGRVNKFIYEYEVNKDVQVVESVDNKDITGDGRDEAIVITVGKDCASCHAKNLYVFEGLKKIYSLELDDPAVTVLPGKGLEIKEPIRKEGEPYCCPTGFTTIRYLWNGKTFEK
jgi:hypothetical protein